MPIYEYECTKCAHRFEISQSITAKPRSRCPECRSKVRKLIGGGVGISFKGSGYYVTDNAPAKPAKAAKPAPQPGTPAGSGGSSGGDSGGNAS